ncbi:MAG: polysaccharide deacetylase family protein [Chloroflexi bacterium]|nr:polysaccharide deacetylase family protein [Chloroflexota bacterium]
MSGWRWSTIVAVAVAALAAVLMGGVDRGAGVGRYVAAQALLERRWGTLDGFVNGLRPRPGGPLDGAAYAGGHYYLTEPPVATWVAAPLYALGALIGGLLPGSGWAPALVALLGPLLLLTILTGVGRLAVQSGLSQPAAAGVVLAVVVALPLVTAATTGASWLLAAALTVWLLVGVGWRGRWPALGHGLLAGTLATSYPWLALASLLALVVRRQRLGWRALGLMLPAVVVGAWQWRLFGRPWRFASQFAIEPAPGLERPFLIAAALTATLLAIGVLVAHRQRRAVWPLAALGLAVVVGLSLSVSVGGDSQRATGLAGALALGLTLVARPALSLAPTRRWAALVAVGAAVAASGLATTGAPAPSLLLPFAAGQRLALALVVVSGAATVLWARRRVIAAALAGLVWLAPLAWALAGASPALAAEIDPLTPPFTAPALAGGPPLVLWRLSGGARLTDNRLLLPDATAAADSPIVAARPGERYCAAAGPTAGQIILQWEDDGKTVLAQHGGAGPQARLCFAAPPATTGVRLRLVGGAQPTEVSQAALWADEARLAPLPDYAVAALAFTFDWESAMGGLIHSKGGSGAYEGEGGGPAREDTGDPLAIAEERGARMRQGAINLATLFRGHGIRGTFYSTGYNLLTGNEDERTFAGDPTYRWATRANGWASNYWTTHRWYGDDPHGDEATDPAWYFGALTRQLADEGHEIESHTFGHLYVRGTTPDELTADLREWNAAARALGLPPARSFAFPWRSSNSLRAPHFDRLAAEGITSLTRIYRLRPGHEYELDEIADAPGLTVFPDQLLSSTEASALAARRAIDEVLLRRGYQSLWTHPEEVVDPAQVALWRAVVDHAAAARDRGLWVAPLVEIVDRVRAGRALEVVTLREPGAAHVWLTNVGQGQIAGAVVEISQPGTAMHGGAVWPDQRERRMRAARLAAGEGMTWTIVAGTGRS